LQLIFRKAQFTPLLGILILSRPPIATKTFVMAIKSSTYSNHIDKCGNREAIYSNQISIVAIEGLLIATTKIV
jgi:hypothetical protein